MIFVAISSTLTYTDDDDDAEDIVENLEWVAVGSGIVANVLFIATQTDCSWILQFS